ncbi:hypothetical protein [Lacinutrix sp. 5H-3-7-4]|uniref:hypothetical protein n=1 Tax=Lacinutrix sp. (strain 5H-3-7-4) TaxID=983544 RepID=UPI00020A3D05|nr:hypothetical protein [Lacinutrix sp. 5H-3-7-4]AEH01938.1 hypothetical protein Lacal_2092 [Lacinutrix sp. 5H-3-7-4]
MKLFFFITSVFLSLQTLNIKEVRLAFKEAGQNDAKIEAFYNSLDTVKKTDNVVLVAYKGAATAMMAKTKKTIKEKKEGFIKGVELVEYAINKAPNNIEARFIRFGIQENTPKLLKYKANMEEDKYFILNQFNTIKDTYLKSHIKEYILQSNAFSKEEKNNIK